MDDLHGVNPQLVRQLNGEEPIVPTYKDREQHRVNCVTLTVIDGHCPKCGSRDVISSTIDEQQYRVCAGDDCTATFTEFVKDGRVKRAVKNVLAKGLARALKWVTRL